MQELLKIKDFYGDETASRSGVPLINHIYEGLMILEVLKASDNAKKAFCIHPIVQNNEPIDVSWSSGFELAIEYKEKANSYLCRLGNDWIENIGGMKKVVGPMSLDCCFMLMADKYQNRKDFEIYHIDTHPRSFQLSKYFELWIAYLRYIQREATKAKGE